jgi:hypothetical protein
MYSMTQKFLNSFSVYEYPKYAEFHADFKSVEIILKNCTQKSYLPKTCANYIVKKRIKSQGC